MRRIRRQLGKAWQKGVASIEFALGFFAFWLLIAAWAEMSYISYVTAIGDLAISEASRSAKKGEDSYDTAFNNVIDSRDFWSKFIKTENFNASVCYVKDLGDLKTAPVPCQSDDEFNAIAIYSVSYDYHSIFGYFLNGDSIFSREVIVVQEYERDKFQI